VVVEDDNIRFYIATIWFWCMTITFEMVNYFFDKKSGSFPGFQNITLCDYIIYLL